MAQAKKHHYVPEGYLKAFADDKGRLFAYRKEEPTKPHLRSISEVAASNYFYAQPLPDGGRDVGLETFFQTVENGWPAIVEALSRRRGLSPDQLEVFYNFVGAQRVRVPAARDVAELALAAQVKAFARVLEKNGELPPLPPELAHLSDALAIENLNFSIDPHQSLLAMPWMLMGVAELFENLGFRIVRNATPVPLITSDNPVAWFDHGAPESLVQPYDVPSLSNIELLMPISPKLLLVGLSEWAGLGSHETRFLECSNSAQIKRANRFLARFGHREVYAGSRSNDAVIQKWSHQSPVANNRTFDSENGKLVVSGWVFGPLPAKPGWNRG